MNLRIFDIPFDTLIHVMNHLRINDVAHLDVAVTEAGLRATFLSLLRNEALSFDIPREIIWKASHFDWVSKRGVRMNNFILTMVPNVSTYEYESLPFETIKDLRVAAEDVSSQHVPRRMIDVMHD